MVDRSRWLPLVALQRSIGAARARADYRASSAEATTYGRNAHELPCRLRWQCQNACAAASTSELVSTGSRWLLLVARAPGLAYILGRRPRRWSTTRKQAEEH